MDEVAGGVGIRQGGPLAAAALDVRESAAVARVVGAMVVVVGVKVVVRITVEFSTGAADGHMGVWPGALEGQTPRVGTTTDHGVSRNTDGIASQFPDTGASSDIDSSIGARSVGWRSNICNAGGLK